MATTSLDKSKLIKWLITIVVAVVLYAAIPVSGVITPEIKKYLVISVIFIMTVALELLPNMVSSLILPFIYIAMGVTDAATALSPWTNTLIYMVIAALVYTDVMTECGLLRRIALMIVNKSGNSFMNLVYVMYFACLIMSYISFDQAWLIMASLAVALCKTMDYKAGDKESLMLMMAVLCGSLSSSRYCYDPSTVPIMETALKTIDPSATITVMNTNIHMAPYIIICLLLLFIMGKVLKVKNIDAAATKDYIQQELKDMGKMSTAEKKALVSLILLVVFVMTSNWHGLGVAYGFIFAALYLYIPGIDLGTQQNIKNVNISTPVFMVACMSIGTVATAVNLNTIICEIVEEQLAGASIYQVFYTIFCMGGIANFFMTPLGIVAALSESVATIANNLGFSARAAVYMLQLSCDFLIFPYENAWILVTFSLGMMKMKDFIKWEIVRTILLAIGIAVLFIPWWSVLGIL